MNVVFSSSIGYVSLLHLTGKLLLQANIICPQCATVLFLYTDVFK